MLRSIISNLATYNRCLTIKPRSGSRWKLVVSSGNLVSIIDDEPDITALFHDALMGINGITYSLLEILY
jgi:hypothetical protein